MPRILAVAETRAGAVRDVSFEVITAARRLVEATGGELTIAIADRDPGRHLQALSAPGVDRVIAIKTDTDQFEAHVAAAALREAIALDEPDAVLVAHSVDSMAYAPAVAATLETGFASDVMMLAWEEGLVVRRGSHGDKLVAELDFPGKQTVIAMLRPGSFDPASASGGRAEVVEADVSGEAPRTRHLGFREPETSDIDITTAPFLLSIGRGIDDEDELPRFEALAEAMGATLSVSRPLVDAGWASSARQVGQSGKTVKPKVYLALGISGAVQHLAGIRDAETVIAVNKDPKAPIFSVADYGAVADLFDITEGLEQRFGGSA